MNDARGGQVAAAFFASVLAAGCAGTPGDSAEMVESDPSILVIGDSVLEWNVWTGESIPEVIGDSLGRPVHNVVVGGAHFSDATPDETGERFDVRTQYVEGDWDWVVLDGGGNDLHDDCGCDACEVVLDDLLSADGRTGEIPDFVGGLVDHDTQVLYIGYYAVRPDADFGFGRCVDEVAEHGRRLHAMAESIEGAWFISAGDVVSPGDAAAYAPDGVHPSPAGSRLIGEHAAAAIERIEGSPTNE